jgi:hypothetical protein
MYGNINRPRSLAIIDNRKLIKQDTLSYENPPNVIAYNEDTLLKKVGYSYGQPTSILNSDDSFRYNQFGAALVKTLGKFVNQPPNIALNDYEEEDTAKTDVSSSDNKDKKKTDTVQPAATENSDKSDKKEKIEKPKVKENFTSTNHADHQQCEKLENGANICGGTNLFPIMDPRFNLRESAKNMILLEDHLFHYGKRCHDCILKHCLTIEGFLEEGITLDKNREYTAILLKSQDDFREIFKELAIKIKKGNLSDEDCVNFAQRVRVIRKPLCQQFATFLP